MKLEIKEMLSELEGTIGAARAKLDLERSRGSLSLQQYQGFLVELEQIRQAAGARVVGEIHGPSSSLAEWANSSR